jgi:hypothetical protein
MRKARAHLLPRAGSVRVLLVAIPLCLLVPWLLQGCSRGGGAAGAGAAAGGEALLAVEYGSLADVYGLRRTASGAFTAALFERDVLLGADIVDERDGNNRNRRDNEILYDFLSANPDNLQPRLLITREIGSPEFARAFAALDDRVRRVTPNRFGNSGTQFPFSVVPRNGALRLTFSGALGIDDTFFYTLANGQITGVRNPEAVQLLRIVGDPNDNDPTGDFEVLPARLISKGAHVIIDPVLLGSEGIALQTRNRPGGMPESADQLGANIRIAIALDGPLTLPAIKRDLEANEIGTNHNGVRSIVRDLRSGNRNDDSAEIARGFRRDPVPPRIIGELLMYLERVEEVDLFTQLLTIYKGDVRHRVDAGDAIRVVTSDGTATPIAITEVIADPFDRKSQTLVRVTVRREDALAAADPSRLPGYPSDRAQRNAWLVQHAPRAVVVAEYEYGDGGEDSDDPQHFVRFTPSPLPEPNGAVQPTRNVSPFAAALVRFSKPLDMSTVRALDSLFFALQPLHGPLADDPVTGTFAQFLSGTNMDRTTFDVDKYATPNLVPAARFDEDGTQTTIRLQPPLGFYLDHDEMTADVRTRTYFLHILGGPKGIKDLPGNQLDLLPAPGVLHDALIIDFTLDVRRDAANRPLFAKNRVVNIARRFRTLDEDEQPSYFIRNEVRLTGGAVNPLAYPLPDLFGAVNLLDGTVVARTTARTSRVADDLNQQPPPSQESDLRWCPYRVSNQPQVPSATATVRFGAPLQNPLNPFGCRLQTIWREIDLNLSRVDPFDFNLDVEEAHWAPHTTSSISFDEFDRMSLFLGHAEFRPENCVGATSALPTFAQSGLTIAFADNYVRDLDLRGVRELPGPRNPPPHAGFQEQYVVIDAAMAFTEPNQINRYMPLPPLQQPHFVWRDETVLAQGGIPNLGADVQVANRTYEPYIISPWLMGGGRFATEVPSIGLQLNQGRWFNTYNYNISTARRSTRETITDGLVGAIALPLLGDFQMYPDEATLPEGRGYIASGANGWQVALTVQSSSLPNYRVYSGGGVYQNRPRTVSPGSPAWSRATGGLNPLNGQNTPAGDNTFYWAQWDFLARQTVATLGFIDVLNPHRVDPTFQTAPFRDPRLGPYFADVGARAVLPGNVRPTYATLFEPALVDLPGGTEIIPQYRGASIVHPAPWVARAAQPLTYWNGQSVPARTQVAPDHVNFPLDPLKAGDAHVRKFEDATVETPPRQRNHWTYPYNLHVTDYVDDPNQLSDDAFLGRYAGALESFRASDVRYCNLRLIMKNNVHASPPVSPSLESLALLLRYESR